MQLCAIRRIDGEVLAARAEGEATVHSSTLLHAVTRLASGKRYSLIVFFGIARPALPAELRFDATARDAEVAQCTPTWRTASAPRQKSGHGFFAGRSTTAYVHSGGVSRATGRCLSTLTACLTIFSR